MSGVQNRVVAETEDGLRLDRWFRSHFPALGHGRLEKLLRTGQIRVDGGRVKANRRLSPGETIRVPPLGDASTAAPASHAHGVSAEDMAWLESLILYRDDAVLVLNKPHGLAVQGGTGTTRHLDGLLDGLRLGAAERPRLVHRLDRDTSGVLVLARSRLAARALGEAFRRRDTRKIYWGLVQGVPPLRQGDIKAPVKKAAMGGPEAGERMVITRPGDRDGQFALTRYATVFQAAQKATWLALMPVTGRTHQLRIHCSHMGTPLVGDGKYGYGDRRPPIVGVADGLHLHAHALAIAHPDGGVLKVQAPLPAHMAETWSLFGFSDDHYEDPFDEAV